MAIMIIRHETAMRDCMSLLHGTFRGRSFAGWVLRRSFWKELLLMLERYHIDLLMFILAVCYDYFVFGVISM